MVLSPPRADTTGLGPSRWSGGALLMGPLAAAGLWCNVTGAQLPGPPPKLDTGLDHPFHRSIPAPLATHPGNVHVEGEPMRIRWPEGLADGAGEWRLADDSGQVLRTGRVPAADGRPAEGLDPGPLGIGWYRVEFAAKGQTTAVWTTTAVLGRLRCAVPLDSPVGVDSATAWFARDNPDQQRALASLAALAGVNWVRDRLRWSELQREPGPLTSDETTYDMSARIQSEAGLKVLQVFHDTPVWARGVDGAGGRLAPDLRSVYEFARALGRRFRGRVAAWEPWNEANVQTFGGHTVDQMCSWQNVAYVGFQGGDPDAGVGWNPTAAVPTQSHAVGIEANAAASYFDSYNLHTYDWSHAYLELWEPARRAAAGRPMWVTEADRGTPHLKQGPWYDQEPRLERLKAEWMAQAYASSLYAGASCHFHFILGQYHEPNGVQFGLLRLDLTPRPAYVALAAVGRCLAGARVLGRWHPAADVSVYAFRAEPDGKAQDVLVAWAEREVDWPERGRTRVVWPLPAALTPTAVTDYLGRSLGSTFPSPLTSAPVFVFLPSGQAESLPLDPPPTADRPRRARPSPLVLQLSLPQSATMKVEDRPWSEGYVYRLGHPSGMDLPLRAYNFGDRAIRGRWVVASAPDGWSISVERPDFFMEPGQRALTLGQLRVGPASGVRDGWVVLRGEAEDIEPAALAFRFLRPD